MLKISVLFPNSSKMDGYFEPETFNFSPKSANRLKFRGAGRNSLTPACTDAADYGVGVYIVLARSSKQAESARQLGLASLILSIVGISLGFVVLVVFMACAHYDPGPFSVRNNEGTYQYTWGRWTWHFSL